jgi:hypothetical protein
MERPPQILNASTNLLGICFVIIGGLKLTNSNSLSFADEIAWGAALLLLTSTISAWFALDRPGRVARIADAAFLAGLFMLMTSVLTLVIAL